MIARPTDAVLIFIRRGGGTRRGFDDIAQRGEQWLEMGLIGAPSSLRGTVNRATHLARACRAYRALGFMKGDAVRMPLEDAKIDDPPRRCFEIGDDVFIADF